MKLYGGEAAGAIVQISRLTAVSEGDGLYKPLVRIADGEAGVEEAAL